MKVVAVHAHPDDEALWTGGLLAQMAAQGHDVLVVTCTLGEEGEVIPEELAQLVDADQLGGYRYWELQQSLEILGCEGAFLGGVGRWRDSGMVVSDHPRAFANAGAEAVEQLTEILLSAQPDLLITYGPDGGYGHPDHIKAHQITHEAAKRLGITNIWWAVTVLEDVTLENIPKTWRLPLPGEIASVAEADICIELSESDFKKKAQAMAVHRTQLMVENEIFALSNRIAQPLLRREYYESRH